MKNNSVKFKKTVPRSSTTSVISEFSQDPSPVANGFLVPSFNHANSISARLSRNSQFNEQNIMFTTPQCRYVPTSKILQDEVLSKSPMGRFQVNTPYDIHIEPVTFSDAININTKYTKESMRRLTKMEKFIRDNQDDEDLHQIPDGRLINLEDETPKPSSNRFEHLNNFENQMELEQSATKNSDFDENEATEAQKKFTNKFNKLINDLRLIRRAPAYFSTFDGQYLLDNPSNSNAASFNHCNGIILNNGKSITSIMLQRETFRVEQICDNPEKINYTALCVVDSHLYDGSILTGSENGSVLFWNLQKSFQYSYFALNDELVAKVQSKPTFISQHLQNVFIGTDDNQVLMLDSRMKDKACFQFQIDQNQRLYRANSISKSPLIKHQNSFQLDSPRPTQNYFDELRETNFLTEIAEEPDSVLVQAPEKKEPEKFGVRYIDVIDYNILATFQNGFIHFDTRKPEKEQFSHLDDSMNTMKALFSPYTSDNVLHSDYNSNKIKVWNLKQGKQLFEKQMEYQIQDFIISDSSKEVLTMGYQDQNSIVTIFSNDNSKLKYCDQIVSDKFQLHKILLSSGSEQLYGLGNYSLRTWKYYNQGEIDLISEKLWKFMKEKRKKLK